MGFHTKKSGVEPPTSISGRQARHEAKENLSETHVGEQERPPKQDEVEDVFLTKLNSKSPGTRCYSSGVRTVTVSSTPDILTAGRNARTDQTVKGVILEDLFKG